MNEIKIPEGHKATILGGVIRIEPIEQKFKKGDIVYQDKSIHIHDREGVNGENHCFASLYLDHDILFVSVRKEEYSGYIRHIERLATPSEQQLLFSALAKEGKYWDAEALEVKDFIKVPENIGIYKWFGEDDEYECGDNLFLGFNNNKQLLGYDDLNKCYLVYPKRNDWQKVQCCLQPCKREDLKAGDTVFGTSLGEQDTDFSIQGCYAKVLGDSILGNIINLNINDSYAYWYKLIPIE